MNKKKTVLMKTNLVDDHDIVAAGQQGVRNPAPDKSGGTGDENGLLSGVGRYLSHIVYIHIPGIYSRNNSNIVNIYMKKTTTATTTTQAASRSRK